MTRALWAKLSLSIVLLTIAFVATLGTLTRPNSYELSVYAFLWPYGWLAITASLSVLAFLLYREFNRDQPRPVALYFIFGLLLLNILLLTLPAFRGYFLYGRGDVPTILGRLIAIQDSNQLAGHDVYPAFYLIVVVLSYLTALPIKSLLLLIPVVMYTGSVAFMFLLARRLFDRRLEVYLTTAAATVMLFSYRSANIMFDNQAMALSLLPFLVAVALAARSNHRYRLLAIAVAPVVPVLHPVVTVLFVTTLGFSALWFVASQYRVRDQPGPDTRQWTILGICIALISYLWFVQAGFFRQIMRRISSAILGNVGHSSLDRNTDAIFRFDPLALLETFLKTLSHDLLFILIASLAVLYLLWTYTPSRQRFVPLGVWLGVSSVAQIGHVVTGVFSLFIYRFVGPMAALTPPLVAVSFGEVWNRHRRSAVALFIAFLLVTSVVGFLSTHPSPYNGGYNGQITVSEAETMRWQITYAPKEANFEGVVTRPFRLADITIGVDARQQDPRFNRRTYDAPPHLGYGSGHRTSMGSSTFLFIGPADRATFTQSNGRASLYSTTDYTKLKNDPTVAKVYSAGGVGVWNVVNSSNDSASRS